MNDALRPSSFGEILDRTIQLYRTRFLVFLGIAAVPAAVLSVALAGVFLAVFWAAADPSPRVKSLTDFSVVAIVLVALPIYIAAAALTSAALSHSAASALLEQQITIVGAFRAVRTKAWRYIWLYLLKGLIAAGAPLTVLFICVALPLALFKKFGIRTNSFFPTAVELFVTALAIYCIWMLLRLSLAFPACVVEKFGAWPALKRSFSLAKGTMGRIFFLCLLCVVLDCLLSWLLQILISIAEAPVLRAHNPAYGMSIYSVAMGWVFISCSNFVVLALVLPAYNIALTLFYYDQRVRLEGFDIEWMMQRAGLVVPPQVPIALASDPQMPLPATPETSPPAEPA